MKYITLFAFFVLLCSQKPMGHEKQKLVNGTFEAKSQSIYDSENYWGYVNLQVQKGKIVDVKFKIRDSTLHEPFDAKYEAHFVGKELYIQQSRNDWKGVQHYPQELLKKQDINDVDAVSGATWSYNFFKSCVEKALKDTEGH
jgi:major membrane immunogen (membrane-anchored lipoprotein)